MNHQKVLSETWRREIKSLSILSGLTHDWGKATIAFQKKLNDLDNLPLGDPVRHEWASIKLLDTFFDTGCIFDAMDAWDEIAPAPKLRKEPPKFMLQFHGWQDALSYIAGTHHKLFSAYYNKLNANNHVRMSNGSSIRYVKPDDFKLANDLPPSVIKRTEKEMQALSKLAGTLPKNIEHELYWRGLSQIGRAFTIMADHHISKEKVRHVSRDEMYANTMDNLLNQPLEWHMHSVGRKAGEIADSFANLSLPGLSSEAVERIMAPAGAGSKYQWQDHAVKALQRNLKQPTIVFNLAGTGAGKTRMNAKVACALTPKHKPIRFSTALNLRTLTLQTGDSYRFELKLPLDELACVIGDTVVKQLHDYNHTQAGRDALGVEVMGGNGARLPEWLETLLGNDENAIKILSPSVLASTIDTLIAAGDPGEQWRHCIQFLRMATSDLILDELDSYDPKGFMAVLRLVIISGMFGRNVIASSATLPKPMVKGLLRAYHFGLRIHQSLERLPAKTVKFRTAYIDDLTAPKTHIYKGADIDVIWDKANQHFNDRVSGMMTSMLTQAPKKIPMLMPVQKGHINHFKASAEKAVLKLHKHNCWQFGSTNKRVSFGLIRVANIKTAIPLARTLSEGFAGKTVFVASYHSQDLLIQRYWKEKRLDELLRRKQGNQGILNDPDIQKRVSQAKTTDVLFIVVATPVEEVGRDHDFDYAVIEPSSTHSIIQTGGRVNRHRQVTVKHPNIAILQYNARATHPRHGDNMAFNRPGLEHEGFIYGSHNMAEIVDWKYFNQLTPALRYNHKKHLFSKWDDAAMEDLINDKHSPISKLIWHNTLWMGQDIYDAARLRDGNTNVTYVVDPSDETVSKLVLVDGEPKSIKIRIPFHQKQISNDWLDLDVQGLASLAKATGIDMEKALSVSIPEYRDAEGIITSEVEWDRSFGWRNVSN